MRTAVLLTLLSAIALCPSTCRANIIVNPSFEASPFAPWQGTGSWTLHQIYHYDGGRSFFEIGGSSVTLSQTISTTPGQAYDLSFWLMNLGARPPALVQVSWGGATVLTLIDEPLWIIGAADQWRNYVVPSLLATAETTTLQFTLYSTHGLALDLVSLEASPTVAPEPANVFLVGTAMLPLLGLRRLLVRRKA